MPHKNEHKNTIQGTGYPPTRYQEIPGVTNKLNILQSQYWRSGQAQASTGLKRPGKENRKKRKNLARTTPHVLRGRVGLVEMYTVHCVPLSDLRVDSSANPMTSLLSVQPPDPFCGIQQSPSVPSLCAAFLPSWFPHLCPKLTPGPCFLASGRVTSGSSPNPRICLLFLSHSASSPSANPVGPTFRIC